VYLRLVEPHERPDLGVVHAVAHGKLQERVLGGRQTLDRVHDDLSLRRAAVLVGHERWAFAGFRPGGRKVTLNQPPP